MKKEENSFEEKIESLENIVSKLEKGDLNLDDSMAKFEEGMKLSKECSKILENASKEMVRRKQGKRDYIKEALNDFEIGEAGEKIVYNHEKQKLLDAYKAGKIENLNDKLEWVSRTDDSLGYDIRSYNVDEKREMYIEVKTTTGSSTTPFYISENEIDKSRELKDKYYIYRLYKMDRHNPKNVDYFILQGDISTNQHVTIEKRNCRVIINNSTEKL